MMSIAPAADLHARHALVPAGDDLALAERERERFFAFPRRVELFAALVEDAHVVDGHGVAGLRFRARAHDQVLGHELGRRCARTAGSPSVRWRAAPLVGVVAVADVPVDPVEDVAVASASSAVFSLPTPIELFELLGAAAGDQDRGAERRRGRRPGAEAEVVECR